MLLPAADVLPVRRERASGARPHRCSSDLVGTAVTDWARRPATACHRDPPRQRHL